MAENPNMFHRLYRRLLKLYPPIFRDRLSGSMEQTFHDLWNEKQQSKKDMPGFVAWMFIETTIGIVREHMLLVKENPMKNTLKDLGLAAGISALWLLPFLLMEFVNRQSYRAAGEEFPIPLFIILFICGMAFILILAPIVQNLRKRRNDSRGPAPESGSVMTKILVNPISAEIIVSAFALPFLAFWAMQILRIEPPFAQALNQPDPDKPNFYNTVLPILGFVFAMTGALVGRASIVQSLQARGRLLARPISLIVVLLMLVLLAWIWIGFIIDQWPCFIGVPGCD